MAFTGQLGTANSVLGNIVLGFIGATAPVAQGAVPPVVALIPIPGVPWLGRRQQFTAQQAPVAVTPPSPPTMPPVYNPFRSGTPIPNVPWRALKPVFVPGSGSVTPKPLVIQPTRFYTSIPIPGVPWLRSFFPSTLPPFSQPAPPPGQPAAFLPVLVGIPIFGVPWTFRGQPVTIPLPSIRGPFSPPPPPPPPGPGTGRPSNDKTLLPRVPNLDTQHGQERLRRFTEILSSLVNSLVGQGMIVQTGIGSYALRSGGYAQPRAPGNNDDASAGIVPGASWVNTTTGKVYFNVENTIGSAVWTGPVG